MKAKLWLVIWLVVSISAFSILGVWVYRIDPYFHYHEPDLEKYYYSLNNQRSQNDGISKHFDYNALISGTSMTENFKSSEFDRIFGVKSIKVAFSGGSYKEINDNIKRALRANPNLKMIIRGLDMSKFFSQANDMRTDLGKYPTYLYDNNPFNDIEYLLNRDVIFGRAYQMTLDNNKEGFNPGITSFDEYSRWQESFEFGINKVCPDGITINKQDDFLHLSESEKKIIKENIEKNVTGIADDYPEVEFYYFYPPYSIVWWSELVNNGTIYKQLEAERYITELILRHENIYLFSLNNRFDLIEDLNNYKDSLHYASWINSLILKWMHEKKYQITQENCEEYLRDEYDHYISFDYESINGQEDYEADYYAAALLNCELTGARPIDLLNDDSVDSVLLKDAEYTVKKRKNTGIICVGQLDRKPGEESLETYLFNHQYIGALVKMNLERGYNYLSFLGQKINDHGQPTVYIYNDNGELIQRIEKNYHDIDNKKHRYVLDLSAVNGEIYMVFNGGYIDDTGSDDSQFIYSKIYIY